MRYLTYFLLAGTTSGAANTNEKQMEYLDIQRGKTYALKDCGKSCGVGNLCATFEIEGDSGLFAANRKCLYSANCATARGIISGTSPVRYLTRKCDGTDDQAKWARTHQVSVLKKMTTCPATLCANDEVCIDLFAFDGILTDGVKKCVKKTTCTQNAGTKAWEKCKNADYYVVESYKASFAGITDCKTDGFCQKADEVCTILTISGDAQFTAKKCQLKTSCGMKEGSLNGSLQNLKKKCYTDAETKAAALALWQKVIKGSPPCADTCSKGQQCGTYGLVGDVAAQKWKKETCVADALCNKEAAIVGTDKKNKIYCEGMKLLTTTVAALAAITYSM